MTTRTLPDGSLVIEDVDLNDVGAALRTARLHRRLMGSEVCHLVDTPHASLSRVEHGHQPAGRPLLTRILTALDARITITVPPPPPRE